MRGGIGAPVTNRPVPAGTGREGAVPWAPVTPRPTAGRTSGGGHG
jgi:hypothetical protein